MKKVFIISAHTDDADLGMGATIHRLVRDGYEVHSIAFSTADKSVQKVLSELSFTTLENDFKHVMDKVGATSGNDLLKNHSHKILEIEFREAMAILGIKSENIHVYGYSVREFTYKRQEILEKLVQLKNKYDPDIVFCPSLKDLHQDHHVIAEEVLRCFKQKNVMMFELSWNQLNFSPETFIEINEFDLQAKLDAIGSYKTQSRKDYVQRKDGLFRGLAIKHGISINVRYAEAFEQPRNVFLIDENI